MWRRSWNRNPGAPAALQARHHWWPKALDVTEAGRCAQDEFVRCGGEGGDVLAQRFEDEGGQRDGPHCSVPSGRQDGRGDVAVGQLPVDEEGPAQELDPVNGQAARLTLSQSNADAEGDGDAQPLGQRLADRLCDLERHRLRAPLLLPREPSP